MLILGVPLTMLAINTFGSVVVDAAGIWGETIYRNGPYVFTGCTPTQGPRIVNLFVRIGRAIEGQIIPEATKGSASPAFRTFFSTNNATAVAEIFKDLDTGARRKSIDGQKVYPPVIVCVNRDSKDLLDQRAAKECHSGTGALVSETARSSFVFICPHILDEPDTYPDFPTKDRCLKLNGAETAFVPESIGIPDIHYNMMGIVIHELAHFYAPGPPLMEEIYLANEARTVSADIQLRNPANFEMFATFVAAGCDQYPSGEGGLRRRNHPPSGRLTISGGDDRLRPLRREKTRDLSFMTGSGASAEVLDLSFSTEYTEELEAAYIDAYSARD